VNLSFAQEKNDQQSVQDKHHTVLAYIKGGVIISPANTVLGNFKPDAAGVTTISDKNHKVLGYMIQGKEIQNADHKTIGYIKPDGQGLQSVTIVDAQQKTIGHIDGATGAVTNNMHDLIGYEINTEMMWAAPYFFFFKF
jgi:predicted aconitase with swiveling domain